MTGFLKRSLLQVVAALVLFAGAGASDLFAGDETIALAQSGGPNHPDIVYTLWRLTYVNGVPSYVLQPVNVQQPDQSWNLDSDGRMSLPFVSTTQLNYTWTHTYGITLTGLTTGTQYAVTYELQSGTSPNFTYTAIPSTLYWTE